MTENKRNYEVVVLVHPDQSEHIKSIISHQANLITELGGLVHRTEDLGRIHLCYPINKVYKAHYTLMNIECGKEAMAELNDNFRFNDAVLRQQVIKVDRAITEMSPIAKTKEMQGHQEHRREYSREAEVEGKSA